MKEILEFNGLISKGEFDEIVIGEDKLAFKVNDWSFENKLIFVRYYISNTPINPNTITKDYLQFLYQGLCENDTYYHCSDISGCWDITEEFIVGGHDVVKELNSYIGKYCYLIVEENEA